MVCDEEDDVMADKMQLTPCHLSLRLSRLEDFSNSSNMLSDAQTLGYLGGPHGELRCDCISEQSRASMAARAAFPDCCLQKQTMTIRPSGRDYGQVASRLQKTDEDLLEVDGGCATRPKRQELHSNGSILASGGVHPPSRATPRTLSGSDIRPSGGQAQNRRSYLHRPGPDTGGERGGCDPFRRTPGGSVRFAPAALALASAARVGRDYLSITCAIDQVAAIRLWSLQRSPLRC